MRNVFFIPPLSKLSGGLANIYDLASALAGQGREVILCPMREGAPGLEEMIRAGLAVRDWADCPLGPGDVWCVPEGWPNALLKGVEAGARPVVYAQNWAYMLGVLPEGVGWRDFARNSGLRFLAVSEPVAWFMRAVLGLEVEKILPPVVRECFFRSGETSERPAGVVRIAWMPRKNPALARQIRQVALELLRLDESAPRPDWVELHGMEQAEVAARLAACDIFLTSSLAEGFGLPPVEGMAAGCVPVGFAGLGGWEYMRSSPLSPCHGQVIASLPPGLRLPEKPWGGNGFYAPEGDVVSAGLALAAAVRLAAQNGPEWRALRAEGRKTALAYGREAMLARLPAVWNWA